MVQGSVSLWEGVWETLGGWVASRKLLGGLQGGAWGVSRCIWVFPRGPALTFCAPLSS